MFRLIVIVCVIFGITSIAHAGSATCTLEYSVDKSLDQLVKIMETHENELVKAAGCRIIKKEGNLMTVEQRLPLKNVILILRHESNVDLKKGTANLLTQLTQEKHPVEDYEMKVYVESNNGKSKIKVTMYSKAAFPSVTIRAHLMRESNSFKLKLFELCN